MKCPCHSGKLYSLCCEPLHQGEKPLDALALMRSRFSAYALNKADYIIATTHPENPSASLPLLQWREEIESFSKKTRFLNLQILDFENRLPYSTVTFYAELVQNGQDLSFTEKSEFAQIEDRWLYRRALTIQGNKFIK
jgi:SEC-C motif-containing protein